VLVGGGVVAGVFVRVGVDVLVLVGVLLRVDVFVGGGVSSGVFVMVGVTLLVGVGVINGVIVGVFDLVGLFVGVKEGL
jgi:hypothetical protein